MLQPNSQEGIYGPNYDLWQIHLRLRKFERSSPFCSHSTTKITRCTFAHALLSFVGQSPCYQTCHHWIIMAKTPHMTPHPVTFHGHQINQTFPYFILSVPSVKYHCNLCHFYTIFRNPLLWPDPDLILALQGSDVLGNRSTKWAQVFNLLTPHNDLPTVTHGMACIIEGDWEIKRQVTHTETFANSPYRFMLVMWKQLLW